MEKRESLEMIKTLHDAFTATGDIECLDGLIEMATRLTHSDKNALLILDNFLEIRNSQIEGYGHANQITR